MHRTVLFATVLLVFSHASVWAMTSNGLNRTEVNATVHKPQNFTAVAQSLHDYAFSVNNTGAMKQGPQKTYHINQQTGTPIFIDGTALSSLMTSVGKVAAGTSPEEIAYRLMESNTDTFMLDNPRDELVLADKEVGDNGRSHLVFKQVYQDIPLWNQQLVVHLDSDGTPYAVNGGYRPTPRGTDVDVAGVDTTTAIDAARRYLVERYNLPNDDVTGRLPGYDGPQADRCIYYTDGGTIPRLAWHVYLAPAISERWHCFVDVENGTVIDAYSASPRDGAATASAVDYFGNTQTISVFQRDGEYVMYDEVANTEIYDATNWAYGDDNSQDPVMISSADNTWDNPIAVTVSVNLRSVYEYYLNEQGRNSVDDSHMTIPCFIHLMEDGEPMVNAYWAGSFIGLGDPIAMSLDVIAHEWTHGVVEYTVGLEYHDEPGAINEAYADLMACMVDDEDWLMNEDSPVGVIRDVSDPASYGLPTNMSEYQYYPSDKDYGGVHVNMSIPSLAGYLVAEELGRDKMGSIFYRVLENRYITPQSKFINLRLGAIQAAVDLYGEESAEVEAVKSAFDQVGIDSDLESPFPPEDRQTVPGEEYIAFINEPYYDGQLTVGRADADIFDNPVYMSNWYVYTFSSQPITVSGDGSYIIYVDWFNNIQFLDLETLQESPVDESGIWSSVALSPNGRYLAATLTVADSTIYVLDLDEPDNSKAVRLYTQTDAGPVYTALYADALDWDHTSSHLLFDAFNRVPVAGGDPVEFWDVNILDVETETIRRVNPPKEYAGYNLQIGNPSYAETNDRYIVCDVVLEDLNQTLVAAVDLFYNEVFMLLTTDYLDIDGQLYENLGHPRFSPDDGSIIFERFDLDAGNIQLYRQAITDERDGVVGDLVKYRSGASNGVWFVLSDESVDVEEDEALPTAIELSQNFPNPFNPTTVIPFSVNQAGHVTLSVYDILGQEVVRLVDESMMPGSYRVVFDAGSLGTGTYISRLEAGGQIAVGKMQLVK